MIEPRGDVKSIENTGLRGLLQARRPALYFGAKIGDSVLALPAVRAFGDLFDAPLTLICPKFAFSLCFREVTPLHVDSPGCFPEGFPPMLGAPPSLDGETVASQIGAVDVLVNTVSFNMRSAVVRAIRQRLSPTATIGFRNDFDSYEVMVGKQPCHAADLMFELVRVLDPSARIENYAHPVAVDASVREKARSIRATLPQGTKVLVVHADTDWSPKRWPVTRFIDLLDRFLSRHRDFVVWVVGMGHEELNVGGERHRVVSHIGLPLDLTMSLVANADLFLGIDSCMLHAADLARIPGVGIFGPTRAATWGFRFAPHRHLDRRNTADITVDEVLDALEDLADQELYPFRRSRTQGNSLTQDLLSAVRRFSDTALHWHAEDPITSHAPGGIAEMALHLHALNFRLWHHEDAVRRPGTDNNEVAERKRSIDDVNASRNAAVEHIDATLLDWIKPTQNTSAMLHSETPGAIVDRLSILTLRIVHTKHATEPTDLRLAVLVEQYDELLDGLAQFLSRLQDGSIRFKQYRQFKSAAQRSHCTLFDDSGHREIGST